MKTIGQFTLFFSVLLLPTFYPMPVLAQEANMVTNAGFELPLIEAGIETPINPDGWQIYTTVAGVEEQAGISSKYFRSGKQSLFMKTALQEDVTQGIWISLPVEERTKYYCELYVLDHPDMEMSGKASGGLCIEWRDEKGVEVSRDAGPFWGNNLSKRKWRQFRTVVTAPKGAVEARLVINLNDTGRRKEPSAFCVDDVVFTEK
ncbi:MAG: hypothetical protein PHP44_15920 [Kiritimatiellae bacterium]|nr:hypothetical protein [Kiritimatiellia bacterium]MDD4737587.1 hypothetical protein [Kiritimatiellia bacterium]